MRISLGTDHAGFELKEAVKKWLTDHGHGVKDFGTHSADSCDYPVFVRPAAEAVAEGQTDYAIVFGGSGNGENIVANKVRGVRSTVCWSEQTAIWARGHNNANCLALGARTIDTAMALRIVEFFLSTPFEGGRHARRVDMIE